MYSVMGHREELPHWTCAVNWSLTGRKIATKSAGVQWSTRGLVGDRRSFWPQKQRNPQIVYNVTCNRLQTICVQGLPWKGHRKEMPKTLGIIRVSGDHSYAIGTPHRT